MKLAVGVPRPGAVHGPTHGGIRRRHHWNELALQRAVKRAAFAAGVTRPVGPHALRHGFAAHLLEVGSDIRTVQELPGRKDVSTTMIYTHVLKPAGSRRAQPAGCLRAGAEWAWLPCWGGAGWLPATALFLSLLRCTPATNPMNWLGNPWMFSPRRMPGCG